MIIYIIIWNLIVFLLFAADKKRAIYKKYRISEKTLLISGLLLGGVGAFSGMYLCRHKTKHTLFKILVPLELILTICAILSIVFDINMIQYAISFI